MMDRNTQIRSADDDGMSGIEHVEPAGANADLYSMTPPVYTQSINDDELTVDTEASQEEKPETINHSQEHLAPPPELPQRHIVYAPTSPTITQQQTEQATMTRDAEPNPRVQPLLLPLRSETTTVIGHYLTEPLTTASLVSVRPCGILHDRPAIWLVKRRNIALSPLVAAVLTQEGLIRPKDLRLISQTLGMKRDPIDPVSGCLFGIYDTIGEIMLGLVAGPVELGRQASPMLTRQVSIQLDDRDGTSQPTIARDVKITPHVAARVAIGTGKGLGRIVTASLKSPVVIMHGMTRGFHNLPKAYGEEVRQFDNVTDLRSGFVVSANGFVCGISDGLTDLVTKPIEGVKTNGIAGFGTGMAKGIGNAFCKPAAGVCGLVGYPFVGAYQSVRNISSSKKNNSANLVHELGMSEYQKATDADKLYIVRVWCQTQMRVRLT